MLLKNFTGSFALNLSLRATKEMARAIDRSMAALVAMKRHPWLNLSGIKETEKAFFLDAPHSPAGLFTDAVTSVVQRFQEAKKQAVVFQRYFPRQAQVSEDPLCLKLGSYLSKSCSYCHPWGFGTQWFPESSGLSVCPEML